MASICSTILYVVPWAHKSPLLNRHIGRFSRFVWFPFDRPYMISNRGGRKEGARGHAPSLQKNMNKKLKLICRVTSRNELTIKQLIYIEALRHFRHMKTQESVQLQGSSPRPPDQGLCTWTPLGAQPPDPHYRLAIGGVSYRAKTAPNITTQRFSANKNREVGSTNNRPVRRSCSKSTVASP